MRAAACRSEPDAGSARRVTREAAKPAEVHTHASSDAQSQVHARKRTGCTGRRTSRWDMCKRCLLCACTALRAAHQAHTCCTTGRRRHACTCSCWGDSDRRGRTWCTRRRLGPHPLSRHRVRTFRTGTAARSKAHSADQRTACSPGIRTSQPDTGTWGRSTRRVRSRR